MFNRTDLLMLLMCAYLRKLITPSESDAATANGIVADLHRFQAFLDGLDKNGLG